MAFDTQERISELEQMSIKTFKTEMQRKKEQKQTQQYIQGLWDNYKRYIHNENTSKEKRKKGRDEILQEITSENFSKLMTDSKPRPRKPPKETKQDKHKKYIQQPYHM